MKKMLFVLPCLALMLSLLSCREHECDSLVGCWSSKRFKPDLWSVYHLHSDGAGRVEVFAPDTCFWEKEFVWRNTEQELLLTYKDGTAGIYYYSLSDCVLVLHDSVKIYEGSYHKQRDCR